MQLLWEQGLHQLPFISASGKALLVQGTHLIDAGVRDVVFLEKGTKTPRVTVRSPPATPYDCSRAHPARGTVPPTPSPCTSARRRQGPMLLLHGATVCGDGHKPQERRHHAAWGPGAGTLALGLQGSAAAGRVLSQRGPRHQRELSSAAEPSRFAQLCR